MTTTINNEHKKLNFSSEREQSQACLNSAEHEKNQGQKVLNVPTKREQNQTCLDSAEREGLRPKGNVPNLRFPEFEGEWENCKFRDVCSISTGNKNTQDKIDDGIYPFYVRSQTVERINSWTFDGEAILTAGDGVGVGKVFHHTYGKIGVHQRVYILSDFKCDANYLFHFFSSKFYNRVKRMSAKNSVDSVRKEMITDMPLSLPSHQEQVKIGYLLSLLDERIATQNKIIDKLQSLIKGIAQKIVRNNKPNVRLAECLEYKSSTLQESEVCEQGTYPVYGANGIVGYLDNYSTEGEAVYIIKDGSGVGTVSYVTGKCSATGTLNTLQAKEGYSLQYLYYLLKVFNFEPYKTGMAIPHIYFKDYGKAKVFCPSYTEQLQYARLLSAIDNKLSIEHNILTGLTLQKQYLLRQMFI